MAEILNRPVRTLRVHCPIDRAAAELIAAGRVDEIDPASPLAAMLAIVDRDGPLGDFGLYRSVVELGTGWELFRPRATARPTLGAPDERTVSPTAILTLYVPADAVPDAEASAIDAIMAAHPWEVPVIERYESTLIVRP